MLIVSLARDISRTARFISGHPIASRHRVKAWLRWLSWQLRCRFVAGPHLVDWINGTKLIVDRGMTGATGNVYCGLHEFADMALVIHFLSGQLNATDSLFVDVGANVGSYTILAAGVAHSRVVCIEPSPASFSKLTRNVEANSLRECVVLIQSAVGDKAGEIRFSLDRDCENRVVDDSYLGASGIVPLETLDELLAGRSPLMMKLDVEGFEEQVVSGALKTLQNTSLQAILLESVSSTCESALALAGFIRKDYDPWNRTIIDDSGNRNLANQLWLRDARVVETACKNAPELFVFNVKV